MKLKMVTKLLAVVTAVSCAIPAYAVTPNQTGKSAAQLSAEILQNQQDINSIQRQIDHARTMRKTTLWVGIPLTVVVGVTGWITWLAGAMSDAPAAGKAAGYAGMGIFAGAIAIAGGTAYLVHLKGHQIDQFQKALTALQMQNAAELRTLNAMK